jgi:hypothetical protein
MPRDARFDILFEPVKIGPVIAKKVYRNYGAALSEQRFKPAGFAAPLGLKDITGPVRGPRAADRAVTARSTRPRAPRLSACAVG